MGKNKKDFGASREERMVISIAEIIQELISAHLKGKDVNLNKMKTRIASKYGLESSPRLVDIIAAVPSEYKKVLLPKLKAKPIRTASGIPNETRAKVQYIVVHPERPSGANVTNRRRRPCWRSWETQNLLNVMKKLNMRTKQKRKRSNFDAVEREMKKLGVCRWNSDQIHNKWCNLRNEWINRESRPATSRTLSACFEFEDELVELLGPDPSYCAAKVDTHQQVKVLNCEAVEKCQDLIDLEALDIDGDLECEVSDVALPSVSFLEDSEVHVPSRSSASGVRNKRTATVNAVGQRDAKKDTSKGTGSYLAALSKFASIISDRQEEIIKMMMEENSKAADEEFKQQQEHEKKLALEYTALLSSELSKIMAENTQNILRGMASMMGLHLPPTQDVNSAEN